MTVEIANENGTNDTLKSQNSSTYRPRHRTTKNTSETNRITTPTHDSQTRIVQVEEFELKYQARQDENAGRNRVCKRIDDEPGEPEHAVLETHDLHLRSKRLLLLSNDCARLNIGKQHVSYRAAIDTFRLIYLNDKIEHQCGKKEDTTSCSDNIGRVCGFRWLRRRNAAGQMAQTLTPTNRVFTNRVPVAEIF